MDVCTALLQYKAMGDRLKRYQDAGTFRQVFRNRDVCVEGSIERVDAITYRWTLSAGDLRQLSQMGVCREKPQVKDEDSWLYIQGDSCVYCRRGNWNVTTTL